MESLVQIAVLIAFILLMLLLNLKAGRATHWSSALLKVASFYLLLGALCALVWKTFTVVFP